MVPASRGVSVCQIDDTDYVISNEWHLVSSPAVRRVVKYPCCDEPYPDLTFVIVIQRIPIFYVIVLIIPCILLSLLTLVSFWLPPETPAKILLGIVFFHCHTLLHISTQPRPVCLNTAHHRRWTVRLRVRWGLGLVRWSVVICGDVRCSVRPITSQVSGTDGNNAPVIFNMVVLFSRWSVRGKKRQKCKIWLKSICKGWKTLSVMLRQWVQWTLRLFRRSSIKRMITDQKYLQK